MTKGCPFERRARQEVLDLIAGKLRRLRSLVRLDDASLASNSYDVLKDMLNKIDNLIDDIERESFKNDLEISKE